MIREQDALAVSLGVGAAGDRPLPRSWFEANTKFDDDAIIDAAMYKANTERRDARMSR